MLCCNSFLSPAGGSSDVGVKRQQSLPRENPRTYSRRCSQAGGVEREEADETDVWKDGEEQQVMWSKLAKRSHLVRNDSKLAFCY